VTESGKTAGLRAEVMVRPREDGPCVDNLREHRIGRVKSGKPGTDLLRAPRCHHASASLIPAASGRTDGRSVHPPHAALPGQMPVPARGRGQERDGQDRMKASRSALIVSAWVVGMPCGKPGYLFSVPFCTAYRPWS